MNRDHLELCSSEGWRTYLGAEVVPWGLQRVTIAGAHLLEIGPGPGGATDILRRHARSLTAVEYDADLAAALAERYAGDPAVDVVHGDATDLRFGAATFDAVTSFTMLHHIPSFDAQDTLFREAARVLKPGGVFFGVDSLSGPGFVAFHHDDICVPIDPTTLADRLEAAGFVDAHVDLSGDGVRWVASTPELDGSRVRLNARFADLYRSDEIRTVVTDDWVPQLLELTNLGDDPLHLAAGPASAATALRAAAGRLTIAELDPAFTNDLRRQFAGDASVEVVDVDPTRLPFPDDRFSAVTVLHSLGNLRSARAQDQTLAEIARVLRPGAALVGLNTIDGSHFRRLNAGDRCVPIDPATFATRLAGAGFTDVTVDLWHFPRFHGRALLG